MLYEDPEFVAIQTSELNLTAEPRVVRLYVVLDRGTPRLINLVSKVNVSSWEICWSSVRLGKLGNSEAEGL